MRYIQLDGVVFGYDATQGDLADAAIDAGGVEITGAWPGAPSLADLAEQKRSEIRAAYETAAAEPVVAAGIAWDGGFDSAIKLDAAKRLAESAGQADVTFYASDNQAHVLDFASALQVVIAVAGAFQAALATKQALMRAIDDAQSDSDLGLVEWPQ